MARPLRIEYPGGVYHVTSRGNARQVFLEVLGNVVAKYNRLCHAFCLLDKHYHILVTKWKMRPGTLTPPTPLWWATQGIVNKPT
jgi:hypothetical protein